MVEIALEAIEDCTSEICFTYFIQIIQTYENEIEVLCEGQETKMFRKFNSNRREIAIEVLCKG